jgi:hypothetical protein
VHHIGNLGVRLARFRVGGESADEQDDCEKKGNDGEVLAKDDHGPGPPSLRSVTSRCLAFGSGHGPED